MANHDCQASLITLLCFLANGMGALFKQITQVKQFQLAQVEILLLLEINNMKTRGLFVSVKSLNETRFPYRDISYFARMLEVKGLIDRRPIPHNKRGQRPKVIELTPEGKLVCEALLPISERIEWVMNQHGLTAENFRLVVRDLIKIFDDGKPTLYGW